MYIYDLFLWLVCVSEVGFAVFEVWAEAGETVKQWAWLTDCCISAVKGVSFVSLPIYLISLVISSQSVVKEKRNINILLLESIHEFTIWEQ